ncbi:hypothetical protein C6990_02900 [Nitrosopumilus sp. b3]|uniref:hypothetical protein n=1 Tax=Nitrosopumilus sp. b3 TaxID=2109909 RepID=UPI0015F3D989|nr:hypothetical protein [Nitrosopumilus sp. b3]KAF6247428.1 hypothetical protein C6990_02900 [Nitrosopumilus sp. b3]
MSSNCFSGIKKKNSRLKNRRGITDIISTMMLMAVTVTGASTLTYFMNDAFLSGNLGTTSTLEASSLNILLLAYDTRDSSGLLTLTDVDNKYDSLLCRNSCSSNQNNIPNNGGTEFIVIQIQNNNLNSIFLEHLSINGERYSWDISTSGVTLDTTVPLTNGKYPADGMFSILPVTVGTIIQKENTEIQSGQTVNLLIKLDSVGSDIQLNKGIRLLLNSGQIQPVEFLLESGGAQ